MINHSSLIDKGNDCIILLLYNTIVINLSVQGCAGKYLRCISTPYHYPHPNMIWSLLVFLAVARLGLVMVLSLVFWETWTLISTVATCIYSKERFLFPASLTAFVIICFLDGRHCDWDVIESQIVLICICLMTKNVKQFLKVLLAIFPLLRTIHSIPWPIFNHREYLWC